MSALNRSKLRQWWLIAFILGVLMINYPFLHIFNRQQLVGGFPILCLYFFFGWAVSIAVIAAYSLGLRRSPPDEGP